MLHLTIKRENIKLLLFNALIFLTLVTLPFNKAALAQSDSGIAKTNLTISPPTYELTANPGDTIENVIKVTSQSTDTITYETIVEDFRVEGQEGLVSLQSDDNPNAFSNWFTVEPAKFTLKPKETKSITFKIDVPDGGEPGGHFASLLFQPRTVESSNATGAQVLQRVGSLVLMTVSGAIDEKGTVTGFGTKNLVGNWDTVQYEDGRQIFTATNEKVNEEKKKSFFDKGPVAFDLVLKNDGNVFFKPKGTVTIYNIFGQKVDEVTVDPRNVFPGGERRITVIWPKKNLWGVRYTAKFTALYGSKNQTLTSDTSFWAFPTPVAIAIAITLIVILLVRKRLIKAIKILAKG
jgi:hypothetical protein